MADLNRWTHARNREVAKAVAALSLSVVLFSASFWPGLQFLGWIAAIGCLYYPHPLFEALDAQAIVKRIRRNERNPDVQSGTFTGFIRARSETALYLLWAFLTISAVLISGLAARAF